MVDVLDALGVRCTVVGNHDFGMCGCAARDHPHPHMATPLSIINTAASPPHLNPRLIGASHCWLADLGVDTLEDCSLRTSFPWLLSNCVDVSQEPPRPLGNCRLAHLLDWHGVRVRRALSHFSPLLSPLASPLLSTRTLNSQSPSSSG